MAKTPMLPAVIAALSDDNIKLATMVKLEIDDDPNLWLRCCTLNTPLYWDEGTGAEKVYSAVGELGSISSTEESQDLSSFSMTVSFSGIPITSDLVTSAYYEDMLTTKYKLKDGYIYLAVLDDDWEIIGTPYTLFVGRIDSTTLTVGDKNATISATIMSRLGDWETSKGGRFTNAYQRTYIDPTDRGFEYIDQMRNIEINWSGDVQGKSTKLVLGTSDGDGYGPTPPPQPPL